MTGLLSDDGFIYQRKLIIYHIIEDLLNSNLAECRIELELIAKSDNEDTYSIDFYIKTNENKYKYYEVKNRISMFKKAELKPVINNFYKLYKSLTGIDSRFTLIHASQVKGKYLEDMQYKDTTNKHKAINKLLGVIVETDFAERLFLRQVLDDPDANLASGLTDFRCIGLIDKILKRYNIRRYGQAEAVYQALRTGFEDLISLASKNIKLKIDSTAQPFPIKESVVISLDNLLEFNNSIIDAIAIKFPDRDKTKEDFYIRFGIPNVLVPKNLSNENN